MQENRNNSKNNNEVLLERTENSRHVSTTISKVNKPKIFP